MALDRIAQDFGFAPFKAKFQGQISEGRIGPERIVLLKPETFMNLSGQSVGEAMNGEINKVYRIYEKAL